jgi:hypothetical protein
MTTPTMHDHYTSLIDELDKTLALVRGFWVESISDHERKKNMERINQLLDERLRLMKGRDAAETLTKGQEPVVAQSSSTIPFIKSVKVKSK